MKYLYLILSAFLVALNANAQTITVSVTDSEQQHIQDIVVYATPVSSKAALHTNPNRLVIGQQDKKFTPYVAVVQKGATLDFENNDDITHHIYSVSGQNNFEFKIRSGETITSQQLNSAEEVAMGCNIHDWMTGYVLVVDTPYYTVTNEQGQAQLSLAEHGDYLITLWHPQLNSSENKLQQTISVSPKNNEVQHWDIKLPNKLLPIPTQENQDDFDFLEEY